MVLFYTILAVVGGLSFAAQAPVNSGLGRKTNTLQASLISFTGGMLVLVILTALKGSGDLGNLAHAKFWECIGGCYGAFNVCVSVTVMPILGVTLALTVNMLGQLAAALAIDTFGWFGAEAVPVSAVRLLGILVVAAGILLIYTCSDRENENRKRGKTKKLLAALLMFIAGISGAVQTPTNRSLSMKIGTLEGAAVSFTVGMLCMLVAVLIYMKGKPAPLKGKKIRPWQYTGGLFGAFGVVLNIITVAPLGTALQTISVMIGEMAGALAIDSTGILGAEKVKPDVRRIIGVAVIAAGVLMVSLAKGG